MIKHLTTPPARRLAAALLTLMAGLPLLSSAHAEHYVAALSPHLPPAQRDLAWTQLSDFALKDLKSGEILDLYDGATLQRISRVQLPADPALIGSPRARLRQIGPELGELRRFLTAPSAGTGPAAMDWALDEPKFLDLAGRQLRAPGEALAVLLVGSALYRNAREPAFDFIGGYYPSDGYLQGDRAMSPFGTRSLDRALDGVTVYHVFPGNECESTAAAQGVARFWALFTGLQGGALGAYSEDAAAVYDRFRHGTAGTVARIDLDAKLAKPEMIRRVAQPVRREDSSWITADRIDAAAPLASPVVNSLRIGARWAGDVDVDIYGATRGNPDLYYGHNRSPEGIHVKDYTSAPPTGGNSYEVIEFSRPVDLRQLGAWLNLYAGRVGNAGIDVEVRVWADNRVYSRNVRIPCASGNGGANAAGRAHDPHWAMIDVPAIVGLR